MAALTRFTARTTPEILEAVARWCWHEKYPGKSCQRIPADAEIAEWLPDCPQEARTEANALLVQVIPGLVNPQWPDRTTWELLAMPDRIGQLEVIGFIKGPPREPFKLGTAALDSEGNAIMLPGTAPTEHKDALVLNARLDGEVSLTLKIIELPAVHKAWRKARATPGGERLKHPLAPLVEVWLKQRPVEPFRPKKKASLPRLQRTTQEEGRQFQEEPLPSFAALEAGFEKQACLPGLEPTITRCPSWLLWLFDQGGGQSLAQGRGAPWTMRLFIGAWLHLKISDRTGDWKPLWFPLEYVEKWLHPDGWDKANRRRDWHKFPEALRRINNLYLPVPGVGLVLTAAATVIPKSPTDPGVEFTVRIPKSAAAGARLNWPVLCQYGKESAVLYRAYLAVVAIMDRTAHRGAPITKEIGAPILKSDETPKRRRGGQIARSRKVLIVHPYADMAPALTDADMARFIGLDPKKRYNRQRSRRAIERLREDGIIETERERNGRLRLFGVRSHAATRR